MRRCLVFALGSLFFASPGKAQLPPIPTTGSKPATQPRLYVAERVKDLGTIIEGDVHVVRWQLENHGSADLVIQRIRASCGCVVAKLSEDEKVIPPGGSLELRADFNTRGRHGAQVKVVTVSSNDPAEPTLKLEFTADLQFLFVVKPAGVANLRSVRRGEPVQRTVDIFPGPGRGAVEILRVEFPKGSPMSAVVEPGKDAEGKSKRIRFTVGKEAALGTLHVPVTLGIRVDGIERTREVSLRAEVVGELTWHPRIVDQTRSTARPGTRLAPVTIRSTQDLPFTVVSAEAGDRFDVAVETKGSGPRILRYSIVLTLRAGTEPGPFATTLNVRTDSLDQPLIRIPVFGVVAPLIAVEPAVILLRMDGTPAGSRRRVKLQASPRTELTVLGVACDTDAVSAVVDDRAAGSRRHLRFLSVTLDATALEPGSGEHHATLTVTTNVAGAERIEIPIIVDTGG